MADIAPLRVLRYAPDALPDLVAPPYDVIGPKERAALGARSPHNVVHLDLPEGEGDAKYAHAAALLDRWVDEGVLREDAAPNLLVYEQTFDPPPGVPSVPGTRITRRGFFALVRAEPYETRAVLPHERTLSGPKEDRYKLFVATRAALSPVFLLYTDTGGAVREALATATPETTFRTDDGVDHRLARVEDPAALAAVRRALADTSLLIADGHHRYETSVSYAASVDRARTEAGQPAPGPRASHRFVLAYLADADDPGLVVFPTHRLVHSLDAFDREAFLRKAEDTFDVTRGRVDDLAATVAALEAAGADRGPSFCAVFPDGATALMSPRAGVDLAAHPALRDQPEVLRGSDVVVLHALVLEALLGITREAQAAYSHLRYLKSAEAGVAAVRGGEGQVLFLTNATPVDTVRRACLAGEVMPQKSTFFHPKVPTGLAIHRLDPDRDVS